MAKRQRYHVNPRPDGKWEVKKEKGARASSVADTKAEAVSEGRQIAKNAGDSQLIIKKMDGTIEKEYTYPRGSDPHPPKG